MSNTSNNAVNIVAYDIPCPQLDDGGYGEVTGV